MLMNILAMLDADTRLKLSFNNDLGIKVNFSNFIYGDIEAEIESFDIPKEVAKNTKSQIRRTTMPSICDFVFNHFILTHIASYLP